jgi:phage tail sheath protein FI
MPGVNVKIQSASTASFNVAATGKWFCGQLLERGSTTKPIFCTSMSEFEELCGGRVPYSDMYDSAEGFFEEGGTELFIARVAGETPVAASLKLKDSAAGESLVAAADSVGEWGDSLEVEVVKVGGGEEYKIVVYETGNLVAILESPTFTTQVAAVTWAEGSPLIDITVGASKKNPTTTAKTPLAGGTYDSAHVETKDWTEAFARLDSELGAGQESAPGITSEPILKALEAHAESVNRTAYIDLVDTAAPATLIAAGAALKGTTGARRTAPYTPWATIPGIATGAPRKCPYSAIQAGITARNDATATPSPCGEAVAGTNGRPRYAIGLTQAFTKQQREELNNNDINVVRTLPTGQIETYGNRTLASMTTDPAWEEVSSARLYMQIIAGGEDRMAFAVFKNIDPNNILLSKIEGSLSGYLKSLGGVLETYSVSTGPAVNTKATKKAKEVVANVEVSPSAIAETATLVISVGA